ncbi:hypothetical protein [Streptomonospora wellingtoniae]|uniref:Uncharacterized protein n=1 Tax=Streptomonospora wellingtoniae TaxID=3075544 RepID=A0ABU2L0J9_9ACTN|nr:hypothetical protein [Streptomonospora sp. DSM 45055]MDT0305055.1 hypothetical protein [Streptomonospora sp. DSM 45055]
MVQWLAGMRTTAERLRETAGVWQDYGGAWTASTTNPSIGNGALAFRYMQIGSTIEFMVRIVWGSTTSDGDGTYDFGLPAAPKAYGGSSNIGGTATCIIEIGSATNRYSFGVLLYNTGLVRVADDGETSGLSAGGWDGHGWEDGNFLLMSGRYEVD